MVNVLRHVPSSPVVDESAMQPFRQQWQMYSKLVNNDYLWHREIRDVLHRQLVDEIKRPFRFLDLACGDASMTVAALQGTPVIHYHGIDLSAPALEMARQTTEALACPVELEQNDFVTAMRGRPEPADVIWIGLSLHHLHTPDKLALMRAVRAALSDGGFFAIYEPTCLEGESREAFLDRFERINQLQWKALTPVEWTDILEHVRTADFPETPSVWIELGHTAGFSNVRELFADPPGFFKMFCFRP